MERLRSSDRVRSIINAKSDAQKYKFILTQNQIESEIVARSIHRSTSDGADTFGTDAKSKKRITRALISSSARSNKLTTTFNEAILESVCNLLACLITVISFLECQRRYILC